MRGSIVGLRFGEGGAAKAVTQVCVGARGQGSGFGT
jgi:hypothetical protein